MLALGQVEFSQFLRLDFFNINYGVEIAVVLSFKKIYLKFFSCLCWLLLRDVTSRFCALGQCFPNLVLLCLSIVKLGTPAPSTAAATTTSTTEYSHLSSLLSATNSPCRQGWAEGNSTAREGVRQVWEWEKGLPTPRCGIVPCCWLLLPLKISRDPLWCSL